MSKAIYKPKGKAGEYAEWACNLFVGCSNDCTYCYCKRGVLAHAMGGPEPRLKACFRSAEDARLVFCKELEANLSELQKSSLFFTFTSDPMIPQTRMLTWMCIIEAVTRDVPCQILTKNADFVNDPMLGLEGVMKNSKLQRLLAWGFTLTGHSELEPGASTNAERIEAMRKLHEMGFRTFASLEPIVSPKATYDMWVRAYNYCDLFKIGLMSGVGKNYYNRQEVVDMAGTIASFGKPVYFKKSLTDYLGIPAQKPINIFDL